MDTKALMRGRVVNKHACHNLCIADESQSPDVAAGKGRVVAFSELPSWSRMRQCLMDLLRRADVVDSTHPPILAEINDYYDAHKCGIGFHGDTERRIVIGVRLGEQSLPNDVLPMDWQWFHRHEPVGQRQTVVIPVGSLYIMDVKASGFDWKRSSQYTLRHAAGAKKYRPDNKTIKATLERKRQRRRAAAAKK